MEISEKDDEAPYITITKISDDLVDITVGTYSLLFTKSQYNELVAEIICEEGLFRT